MKMNKHPLLIILALSIVPFLGCYGADSEMDVEELARDWIRENGFHVGYEARARRMVQFSVSSVEIGATRSNPRAFEELRVRSFSCAEFAAKASIMRSLAHVTSMKAESAYFAEEETTWSGTTASSEVKTAFFPYGCKIETSFEAIEEGVLKTAVILSWTPDAERGARQALYVSDENIPANIESDVSHSEWIDWAETQDFSQMPGFRSFVDSEGVWRFVGIGMADIDGKSGPAIDAAMKFARQTAGENLAYALIGNVEASRNLRERMREFDDGEVSKEVVEACVSETMRKTAKGRMMDSEVYTTTVVHPLSGRKLFVSVAGIEPSDLAEMNLLGVTGRGGASGSGAEHRGRSTGRPDHGARPASNRPDHGARPASNRPEHLE